MIIPNLAGIVCGFEHSGTTLAAQLLRQHPDLETGFEVGALLYDSPQKFLQSSNPWSSGMLYAGWKIVAEDVAHCETFAEFYATLAEASPLVRNKTAYLIDKTPKYQEVLSSILSRFNLAAIVMHKDPVLLYASWHQRGHTNLDAFITYYRERVQATQKAKSTYPDNVLLVSYTDLVRNTTETLTRMFVHLGYTPVIKPIFDNDWEANVYGNTVQDDIEKRMESVPDAIRYRLEIELG